MFYIYKGGAISAVCNRIPGGLGNDFRLTDGGRLFPSLYLRKLARPIHCN